MPAPAFSRRVPDGDTRARRVCDACGFVDYQNPRLVVGAVCHHEDRLLLCRRAIEPRVGYWTMPAGFLESHETCAEGAARETREEARAEIEIDSLLVIYEVPRLSQVHLIYRAAMRGGDHSPGPESLETRLFRTDAIPWNELAFPSVEVALRRFLEVRGRDDAAPLNRSARGELADWFAVHKEA